MAVVPPDYVYVDSLAPTNTKFGPDGGCRQRPWLMLMAGLLDTFQCVVCLELAVDPVSIPCGWVV